MYYDQTKRHADHLIDVMQLVLVAVHDPIDSDLTAVAAAAVVVAAVEM